MLRSLSPESAYISRQVSLSPSPSWSRGAIWCGGPVPLYGAAGAGRGGVLKWRPPPCPVSAFVCYFLRGGLVVSVLRPIAVRGWGRGREDGTDGPAPARARLVSLLLSRGVLPLSPPPPSPAGGRGSARLVRGWASSHRRPSALHASSRVGAGAQVNKGRLPRNFKLDKSERTCYYTGARLVSGPWAPAFEQSVTLGERSRSSERLLFLSWPPGICAPVIPGHFPRPRAGKPAPSGHFFKRLTIRKLSTGCCPLLEIKRTRSA